MTNTTVTVPESFSSGLPRVSGDERTAIARAIRSASKDTLREVLRTKGSKIYRDPTAAAENAQMWADAAAQVKADVAWVEESAAILIRNARHVDPRIGFATIGYDVEGWAKDDTLTGDELKAHNRRGNAIKQRWTNRYGVAFDLVERTEKARDAGLRESAASFSAALTAARTTVPRDTLRRLAEDGKALPTFATADAVANGETVDSVKPAKVYTAASILRAVQDATTRAKHPDPSKVSQQTLAEIRAALLDLTNAVGALKVTASETPEPKADSRKPVPTPKDVAPKA